MKALFKAALLEVQEERKDLWREATEETLEGMALACALEAGQCREEVSRGEVFSLLEGGQELRKSRRKRGLRDTPRLSYSS